MLARTTRTAPVTGLEDYRFEKTKVWSFFYGKYLTQHAWFNTVTEDWATKFATKAQAVAHARRFEKGLRKEQKEGSP